MRFTQESKTGFECANFHRCGICEELTNVEHGHTVQPAYINLLYVILDVTHVRLEPRLFPALSYCKRQKAGEGPGNEAKQVLVSEC